ncbi:alpha/beta hydrolase [Pseudorhodoferax sp. Leaf265]|uniref:alpha/beta hydrolase n=1 Tax=Pseudorhodoferax sp. Leaf265 TaxID=1736315 RepID=UPI0006FF28BE|nr:alpha/beta fold hydrolase [Pseudorhodoferax sp. Leaf265]KQP19923.1 alpha/beta hydrolase [Pseudorhodoferax sp. Leaf265]
MRRLSLIALLCSTLSLGAVTGCSLLDERQRDWIFQPGDRAWGGSAASAEGMEEVWIGFDSKVSKEAVRLHGLWLENESALHADGAQAPILLYLHGARWNVQGSAPRMRAMQQLGFSVLAIDYRGFGKSTSELPSEDRAFEDARAAWDWLAARYPDRPRYIFGHSLGGAIAIDLASKVKDERGVLVEGTFTSIPEVAASMKWGWLPIGWLITQRMESIRKVPHIGAPLLVVHGSNDSLIKPDLGRRLYEAAQEPKAFVVVDGGTHHNTIVRGQAQYRTALQQLFGWPPAGTLAQAGE